VYARAVDDAQRQRFDRLLEEALERLPQRLKDLLEEIPLVVDDRPDDELARSLIGEVADVQDVSVQEFASTLCGLHTGIPLTARSVEAPPELPTDVRLFREGIVNIAGGWEPQRDETQEDVDDAIYEEIMVTILHELGHHFGLGEDDLESLGYA